MYIILIFLISVLYSNTWSVLTQNGEVKKATVEIIFEQRKVLFVQNFNRIKIKIKNIDREETGENVSESWNEDR